MGVASTSTEHFSIYIIFSHFHPFNRAWQSATRQETVRLGGGGVRDRGWGGGCRRELVMDSCAVQRRGDGHCIIFVLCTDQGWSVA